MIHAKTNFNQTRAGTRKRHAIAQALALVILETALSPALAQDAGESIEAASTLDTIVVTANKRVENVQEVPKSVMVVTAETLSKAGVVTIRELGNISPSIAGATSERPGFGTPPIRGISSFSYSIGVQSQTGIVIDDVPQSSFSSLYKELSDIQQVEILAGPQSTLSGRNASGGLINIVTRAPSDFFEANLFLEQTSDRQQRFTAFMTGPLSSTLAFSVSAFSNEWEGPLRSLFETNGNRPLRLGGWDTQGARGKLRWQPNDRLNATFSTYTMESTMLTPSAMSADPSTYFYFDPNARHAYDRLGRSMAELYPGLEPGLKRYNRWVSSPRHGYLQSKDRGGSLRVEYELDNAATLTSITSLTRTDAPRVDNYVDTAHDAGMNLLDRGHPLTDADYHTETRIQEFRLTSPGGQRFDYLVGAIYSDADINHPYQRLMVGQVNWIRTFSMESSAVFARGTWHLGERDALTAGLRYQRDDLGYGFAFLPLVPDFNVAPDYFASGSSKYDFLSGEISWRHELADDINAYVTFASTQSGEVYDLEDSRTARDEGLQPLDSQKVRNIELGLKSQWFERRLTFNINAFLARYDNYHVQTSDLATDPNQISSIKLYAIGEVETRGVEFETRFRVTENLNFNFNGAFIDAKIKDYPEPSCHPRQTAEEGCNPITRRQGNLAGTPMPNTPEFKFSGALSYFVALDSLPFDLEFASSYRWQSKTYFDFRGDRNLYEGSYGVLNLSGSLLDRDGRYSVSVFVNNVLNKNFYARVGDYTRMTAPARFGSFARDSFRYAGVNLRVNF